LKRGVLCGFEALLNIELSYKIFQVSLLLNYASRQISVSCQTGLQLTVGLGCGGFGFL